MNSLIAIVEDEEDIAELESSSLAREGYKTRVFRTGSDFLDDLGRGYNNFILIILDLMLPETNGTEILKLLKNNPGFSAFKNIPVIIVSARDTELDKVLGLEIGADDYISKPFSPRELIARTRALLRRSSAEPGETLHAFPVNKIIRIGNIEINEDKFQVHIDGREIPLTSVEFRILVILSKRKGWVFDRNKLMDQIWSGEKIITGRTIDVHIKHLREKLEPYSSFIKTVRGVGYKLDDRTE
jgi:two-component system phosphate regulon response regulator PhoB/two-component system alkaline phosphatase synthesis response regulator PhoP